jgi:hypothetical protein
LPQKKGQPGLDDRSFLDQELGAGILVEVMKFLGALRRSITGQAEIEVRSAWHPLPAEQLI